ncbi:TetR/AcrR family transcriptional regulator [Croceicoccus estronivorus]|uniref:TetR/AcrR family transcriptional regulator n=1 Tax=Croceicoccus estronivorus TaxID=1172626 RepID=UPI0014781963|nr:TetR/AcrR family transcriptional regulator [Croceicoccus estronivorus]
MTTERTTTAPRRSPGRPRDASREKAILVETLALLGELGFSGLTVDAVVARAKVSKATIYRRWATKEELAIAAFDLLPLIEVPETGNLESEILGYIDQYYEFLRTTPLPSVLPALVSEAMHNEALAERLHETVDRRRASGIAMIQRAIDRGELPEGTDPALAHELMVGPMVQRSFFEPDNFKHEDFSLMAKIIIAGLKTMGPATSSGD